MCNFKDKEDFCIFNLMICTATYMSMTSLFTFCMVAKRVSIFIFYEDWQTRALPAQSYESFKKSAIPYQTTR